MMLQQQPDQQEKAQHSAAKTLALGRFAGREAFREQLRYAFASAAGRGWQDAIFCDADFADWPLGERDVEQWLDAWARAGTRFIILAQRYDDVLRRHARFVRWRERWSHRIECRFCAGTSGAVDFPSAFWTPGWVLHRVDAPRSVCVASDDAVRRVELRELLERWLGSAVSTFPATTLGL